MSTTPHPAEAADREKRDHDRQEAASPPWRFGFLELEVGVLVVAVAVLAMVRRADSRAVVVAAGLVAGGAVGNVVDRLFRGEGWMRGRVIDFIDFQWFPIFNVADIGVDVGAGIFVIWSLVAGRSKREVQA